MPIPARSLTPSRAVPVDLGAAAARVAALLACLAVAAVWVSPPAHGTPDPSPGATSGYPDTAALDAAVDERRQRVDAAHADVDAAALAAADALEAYTNAVRRLDAAHADEDRRRDLLDAAQQRLADARAGLGRWARSAYAGGEAFSPGAGLATILRAGPTDDLGASVTTLRRVGAHRSRALTEVATAERLQREAATAATAASQSAETAAVEASAARGVADAALQRQREILAASETALAQAQSEAARAKQRAEALEAAERLARIGQGTAGGNRVTGPVGSCAGGDVEHYPNGMIPVTALCELSAQPGRYLRADAALAFDSMSRAFAARFGTPICVTDSYRTYDEQVRLKLQKPTLAATPGTSNHGWGTATDLCGGIQSFQTPQHAWLATNAPLYNWFHPSWARIGGGKPEPWHFEYAG
jgi:hypothetical protein